MRRPGEKVDGRRVSGKKSTEEVSPRARQRATGEPRWGKMTWTEPKEGHVPAIWADRDVRCACHYRSKVQTAPLAAATATHKRTAQRKACPPRTIGAYCRLTKSRTRRSKAGDAYLQCKWGEDPTSWDSRHAAELLILAFAPTGDSFQATSPNRPRHYSQASGYPCMPVYTVCLMRGCLY